MAKLSYDKILKSLLDEEEVLKFPYFSNDTALELGFALVEQALREKAPMTIDITRNGQQLFHAALPGTLVDNDRWVERKNRVVNQLHHSSMYYHYYLLQEGKTIDERYHISAYEYSPYGGAFPMIVEGTGVIGTITVSGLPQEEDHRFVTEGIRNYLKKRRMP
jgi:uncharacterized protein (UPF0303 family)